MVKYWFKNKKYGIGWRPSTWQGWAVIFTFVFYLILLTLYVSPESNKFTFFINFFVAISLLIYISWKKGEPLQWNWFKKK